MQSSMMQGQVRKHSETFVLNEQGQKQELQGTRSVGSSVLCLATARRDGSSGQMADSAAGRETEPSASTILGQALSSSPPRLCPAHRWLGLGLSTLAATESSASECSHPQRLTINSEEKKCTQ